VTMTSDKQRRAKTEAAARECAPDPIDRQLALLQQGFRALEARYKGKLFRRTITEGGRTTELAARSPAELDALAAKVRTLFAGGAVRNREKRANEMTAAAITASDGTDDPAGPFTELVVGGAGNLPVVTVGGSTVTYAVVAGQRLQINVRRVKATGLTATGVIGQK
jgi:hypothetical protein